MLAGIKDILIITTPHDQAAFKKLLKDGSQWNINISYEVQYEPKGLAEAFIIGENFIRGDQVALILGDNIFHGQDFAYTLQKMVDRQGATAFAYQVSNPHSYGVVEFDDTGKAISIEEKPKSPKSSFALPGLYFFDSRVSDFAKSLEPSSRNELEITDILELYLSIGQLTVEKLEHGSAWLDAGTFESLSEAGEFIRIIQLRQGIRVGCPESTSV